MELFFLHQVSQITENFRNGHTGQLSFIMVLLLLFTHAARIFTTMQETGDQYILAIFTLSTVFNITMVTQILYYWNATIDAQKKKEQGTPIVLIRSRIAQENFIFIIIRDYENSLLFGEVRLANQKDQRKKILMLASRGELCRAPRSQGSPRRLNINFFSLIFRRKRWPLIFYVKNYDSRTICER